MWLPLHSVASKTGSQAFQSKAWTAQEGCPHPPRGSWVWRQLLLLSGIFSSMVALTKPDTILPFYPQAQRVSSGHAWHWGNWSGDLTEPSLLLEALLTDTGPNFELQSNSPGSPLSHLLTSLREPWNHV